MKQNIIKKIENYLNENETKYNKKIIDYINKKYPNIHGLNITINDRKKWYLFEYLDGFLSLITSQKKFTDLGIGDESNWDDENDIKLKKILNVKKVYIMDL